MSRLLRKVIEKPEDCPYRGHFGSCAHPDVEQQWEKEFFGLRCDEEKTGKFPRLCLLKEEGGTRVLHKVIEKPEDCPYHGGLDDCDHPDKQIPADFFGMVCDEEKTGEFPRLCRLKLHLEGEKKKIATDIRNFLMGNVTGREMLEYTFEACQATGSSELSYLFDYYNKHHTPEATFEDFKNAWEVEL